MDEPKAPAASVAGFEEWMRSVRDLVDSHVGGELTWYERHTRRPWLLFRVSGSLLILLSISLPVLSSIKSTNWPSKDLVVSAVALIVALLSALSTFFHWHETWRENTRAKMELRNLLAGWQLAVLVARQQPAQELQVKAVVEATEQLFIDARKVGAANTEGYFKNVKLPDLREP